MKEQLSAFLAWSLPATLTPLLLGVFGGSAHFLFLVSQEEKTYAHGKLLLHSLLGGFVSLTLHYTLLELTGESYVALLLIGGFLSTQVLELLDQKGLRLLRKKLGL